MNRTTFSQIICSSIMVLMVLIVLCYNIDSTQAIPIRRYYLVNRANNRIIDIQNPKDFRRIMNEMMTQHQIDDDYQADRSSSSLVPSSFLIDSLSNKRGIDLGLSRGFSGSQAAKHLIGISAANFAHGPGRKRRSVQHEDDQFDRFNNDY